MSILDRFFSTVREQPSDPRSQSQREATLDLLILTMYADHHLALSERRWLDAEAAQLEWDSVLSLGDFLAEAVSRARDVIEGHVERDDYLKSIGERLGDARGRGHALGLCRELMGVDGRIREEEVNLLKAAQQIFSSLP